MKIEKKINVILIGYGYWGPNLARNINNSDNFNLIGICDINKKNLLKAKKKYPKINIFKDYKKAIKEEKIELVAIASPTSTHYKIAKFSLNNNKNILVEKPITLKLKDLNSLYKISEKVKKNIFVDYPFLFSGATELIKKIITTKKFGNPYSVEFIREQAPIKSDSSVFWDLGIHDISILYHIFKENFIIQDKFKYFNFNKKIFDTANIFLKSVKKNIHINIKNAWVAPTKIRLIKIRFKNIMIVCDENEPIHKVIIYKKFSNNHWDYKRELPKVDLGEPISKLLNYIFKVIRKKGDNNLISKKFNLKVTKLMEKVEK